MGRIIATAAAAAIALAPLSGVATTPVVAQAAPCAGDGANPVSCQNCMAYVEAYQTSNVCYNPAPPRTSQPRPSRVPVWTPPEPVPVEPVPPAHTPVVVPPSSEPPTTVAVQTPKLNPGAPGNAPVVAPPKGLEASPQAIADAKAAPATRINPARPLEPPSRVYDFGHQVQNAVAAHSGNIDLVNADNQELVRPRHWDYIDYDDNRRPVLYNPLREAVTFRYFYDGAYREAFVAAGGRIVLDAAAVGLFPFTAVGYSHVASGSFYGGASIPAPGSNGPPPPTYAPPARPEVYQNIAVLVAAADKTVAVGQVQVVGHDASQPAGGQDTFLLDDSTLAWGQVTDPGSPAQIRVVRTQSLPGAGPTDNGGFLVALAAIKEPKPPVERWWLFALSYGGLATAVCLAAWLINRRRTDSAAGP
ncbi:hypothetical protein BST11_01370 [Mycobacterium alsense]|uniref:DUF3068 domain-containing protein n=1 Tax=Mycobacterium alsense TaxID=324058 RepID=A0AA41XN35_9MYCO|nr:hypothetical protein [Mycobacterium alsense]MCV7378569.1 hypothetical protein [Mycobacterium alsense]OQZ93969.1 hypothetical protein BST11_01370 [Mycobacterium alsense]